jgi:hypothetical protein
LKGVELADSCAARAALAAIPVVRKAICCELQPERRPFGGSPRRASAR